MADKRKDKHGRVLKSGEYYNAKTGVYQFRKMVNGKRTTISAYDLAELRIKENELVHNMDYSDIKFDRYSISLNQYFGIWVKTYAPSKIKSTSLETYRIWYKRYVENSLGRRKVRDISKADIQALINDMAATGKGHSTMNILRTVLLHVFNSAIDEGIIVKNPCVNTNIPDTMTKKRDAVPMESISAFLNYLKSDGEHYYLYPFFVTLFSTGLRIGEIAALTWDNIDYEARTIKVEKTLYSCRESYNGFTAALGTPKSASSVRTIDMTNQVKQVLLMQELQNPKSTCTLPLVDYTGNVVGYYSDFVFRNKEGKPWKRCTISTMIQRIVEKYNVEALQKGEQTIETFSPHQCRHTFTTLAYEAGIDVKMTSQTLGHKSVNVTMDVYTHLSEEKRKEEKRKIELIKIS